MTEPTSYAMYRVLYLLHGASKWQIDSTEFLDIDLAQRRCQGLHDKFMLPADDSPGVRTVIMAVALQPIEEIEYDGGVNEKNQE